MFLPIVSDNLSFLENTCVCIYSTLRLNQPSSKRILPSITASMAHFRVLRLSLYVVFALILVIWLSRLVVEQSEGKRDSSLPPANRKANPSTSVAQGLPHDYSLMLEDSEFCRARFSQAYLRTLADSASEYCTPNSPSSLTCFHSSTVAGRTDSFCLARGVAFDRTSRKFSLQCKPREDLPDTAPPLGILGSYWYNTGPQVIFDQFIEINSAAVADTNVRRSFTILVKREGSGNLWHSLMEIFSMTLSLDVLHLTMDFNDRLALFTDADEPETQVILLDDEEDGPYINLWTLLAKKPLQRISSLSPDVEFGSIIVPLAGGSNPFWQGDWQPNSCTTSDLLSTFSHRVLRFHDIDQSSQSGDTIVVTFINRTSSRVLLEQEEYLAALSRRLAHTKIQSVDFASIPLREQLRIASETDVLIGVHGAGLTHGMFLRPRSAVVEILPPDLDHKGFRNLASYLNHGYYCARASKLPHTEGRGDWHQDSVFLDQDLFLHIVELAVESLYNRGSRNFDIA